MKYFTTLLLTIISLISYGADTPLTNPKFTGTAKGTLTLGTGTVLNFTTGTGFGGAGGSIATDTIWDAAGDLVYGTANNTASRLAVGTNGQYLSLTSGLPAWVTLPSYQPLDADLTSWAAITRGTGFDTAAATNVGTAGAFLLNNGSGASLTSINASTISTATQSSGTGYPVFVTASGTQTLPGKTNTNLSYDAANQLLTSTQLACKYFYLNGNVFVPPRDLTVVASGLSVNASGATVTGTGVGSAYPAPSSIVLDGTPYTVSSVTDANTIVLANSAGTLTSVQPYTPVNDPNIVWEALKADKTSGITIGTNNVVSIPGLFTCGGFSQYQYFLAGGVTTPAISFTADSNTGFYSYGADQIGFAAGGAVAAALSTSRLYLPGNIELGDLGDTTLARVSAGVVSLEGSNIVTASTLSGGTLPASLTTGTFSSNLKTTGTGANGYLEIANQAGATAVATPTSAIRFFSDSSNRFSWKGANGFVRTFDGTANTADRVYVLPNSAGTVALTTDITGGTLAGSFTTLAGTSSGTFGVNGGTGGSLVLRGATSGSATINTSATGVLALPNGTTATSMALTTPVLGAATGTSLALGGATLAGGEALSMTGILNVSGAVKVGQTLSAQYIQLGNSVILQNQGTGTLTVFGGGFGALSQMQFGGTSSSFASLQTSGTTITTGLANGTSGGALVASGTLAVTGATTLTGNLTTASKVSNTMVSTTLSAAATTLAETNNFIKVTGDAGANTLSTITGGLSGQTLTLLFVDALVTITDTAAATANTVDLSAAFTSTANDTLTLIFDGNKWFEISRSAN